MTLFVYFTWDYCTFCLLPWYLYFPISTDPLHQRDSQKHILPTVSNGSNHHPPSLFLETLLLCSTTSNHCLIPSIGICHSYTTFEWNRQCIKAVRFIHHYHITMLWPHVVPSSAGCDVHVYLSLSQCKSLQISSRGCCDEWRLPRPYFNMPKIVQIEMCSIGDSSNLRKLSYITSSILYKN